MTLAGRHGTLLRFSMHAGGGYGGDMGGMGGGQMGGMGGMGGGQMGGMGGGGYPGEGRMQGKPSCFIHVAAC